MTNLDILLLK